MKPTTHERVEPPATVLALHGPGGEPEPCRALSTRHGATAELRVTFPGESPDGPTAGERPAKMGVISIGDVLRSASAADGPDFSGPIAVDAIEDPADLTAIGLSVSRFCERWATSGERIVVCFHSLNALLRHVRPDRAFRFVHTLAGRFDNVNALAYVHWNVRGEDERLVSTFTSIFDEVICSGLSPSEATDEDVAEVLAAWEAPAATEIDAGRITEATDEDVARIVDDTG